MRRHNPDLGLDYQYNHTIYQAEGKQDSVLQDGILYTADGKRIPEDVDPQQLSRVHIPPHLEWMTRSVEAGANPFAVPQVSPVVSDFTPEEIAQAIALLRQARGFAFAVPPPPEKLAPPIPHVPVGVVPSNAELQALYPPVGHPPQPKVEFEEIIHKGIIERRPKGQEKRVTKIGR